MTTGMLPLRAHSAGPSPIRALEATITRPGPAQLAATWRLSADLSRLRVPAVGPVGFVAGLWEHTCFELFVRIAGSLAYFEFNLSPSRSWAAFAFSGYRAGRTPLPDLAPPTLAINKDAQALTVESLITLPDAVFGRASPPLEVAVAAVIEDVGGTLSYWALKHPEARPDFHHPDSFLIRLDRAASSPADAS